MDIDDIPEIVGPKETLEAWLHTDVGDYHGFLKVIDDVLAGNIEENYLGGNGSRGYGKIQFQDIYTDAVVGRVDDTLLEKCNSILNEAVKE